MPGNGMIIYKSSAQCTGIPPHSTVGLPCDLSSVTIIIMFQIIAIVYDIYISQCQRQCQCGV